MCFPRGVMLYSVFALWRIYNYMSFKMKFTIFILFLSTLSFANAQLDSSNVVSQADSAYVNRWYSEEKSYGIVPEFNFYSNRSIGVSFSKGKFTFQEFLLTGSGLNAGLSYSFADGLFIPHASAWFNAFMVMIPIYGGVRTMFYTDGIKGSLGVRPEIGIGFYKVNLFFGYNYLFNSAFPDIKRETVTLSYYHTLFLR